MKFLFSKSQNRRKSLNTQNRIFYFQGFAFLFYPSQLYSLISSKISPTLRNRKHSDIDQDVFIIAPSLFQGQFLLFCSKTCTLYLLAIRGEADTVNWLVKIKLMYHTFPNQTHQQGSSLCKGRKKKDH